MSAQEFIFSEFPEIEEDDTPPPMFSGRMSPVFLDRFVHMLYPEHLSIARICFKRLIMRLLPPQWVISFRAYEALGFYDLEDFINMTHLLRTPESNRQIMALCIQASEPDDWERYGSTPIAVLSELKRFSTKCALFPRAQQLIAKFDGKMYALARSPDCYDSERILILFCTRPARIIQYAWKKYQERKRDQASRIIQEYIRDWLYRPGGPMMKKAEASFYTTASKQ